MPPHPAAPDAAFAADVRAFAAAFWATPPADRHARWRELTDRAVGPAAGRLRDLAAGLGVTPVPLADARAAEVSRLVCELFALPPAERAARRLAWLTDPDRRDPGWNAAARVVQQTDAPLARLDARLFDWFELGARPEAVAAVDESEAWVRPPRKAEPAPAASAGGFGCLSGPAAILFAVIVVGRLIISAASGPSGSPTPAAPPPPAYAPAFPSSTEPPTRSRPFTIREVVEFQDYEEAVTRGRVPLPPPRYDLWVQRGRPPAGAAP